MVVETIRPQSDRPVTDLAAALELAGGALVVLRGQRGLATTANVYLPADDDRQARCRRAIEDWTHGVPSTKPVTPARPLDIRATSSTLSPDRPGCGYGCTPPAMPPVMKRGGPSYADRKPSSA